jgi:phosphoglycolate phosphatase
MPPFKTILFDLDGTIIDHFEAIHLCHTETMTHFGLPAPTPLQVRNAVGGGLEEAVRKLFAGQLSDKVAEAIPFFRACWPRYLLVGVKPLPGALELLARLHAHGIACAVFTNKHGPSAREVCEHLGMTPYLRGIVGAFDTPWLKPQREFAEHTLRLLGADAATTLLIGDSPYDVQAGRNGGFPVWCVTTGTHNREELAAAGADAIYDNLPEVGTALTQTGLSRNT